MADSGGTEEKGYEIATFTLNSNIKYAKYEILPVASIFHLSILTLIISFIISYITDNFIPFIVAGFSILILPLLIKYDMEHNEDGSILLYENGIEINEYNINYKKEWKKIFLLFNNLATIDVIYYENWITLIISLKNGKKIYSIVDNLGKLNQILTTFNKFLGKERFVIPNQIMDNDNIREKFDNFQFKFLIFTCALFIFIFLFALIFNNKNYVIIAFGFIIPYLVFSFFNSIWTEKVPKPNLDSNSILNQCPNCHERFITYDTERLEILNCPKCIYKN